MKTHYILPNEQKSLCGHNHGEQVTGYKNISEVTCEICKQVILTNAGDMVDNDNGVLKAKEQHNA